MKIFLAHAQDGLQKGEINQGEKQAQDDLMFCEACVKKAARVIETAGQPKVAGDTQHEAQRPTQGPKDHAQASFRHLPPVNKKEGIGGQEDQGVDAKILAPKGLGDRVVEKIKIPSQGQAFEEKKSDEGPASGFFFIAHGVTPLQENRLNFNETMGSA